MAVSIQQQNTAGIPWYGRMKAFALQQVDSGLFVHQPDTTDTSDTTEISDIQKLVDTRHKQVMQQEEEKAEKEREAIKKLIEMNAKNNFTL